MSSSIEEQPISATPYTDVTHTVKDPLHLERVKRPLNGFMIWSQIQRKRLTENDPQKHHAEVSKQLGSRWKELSEQERDEFNKQAKHLKYLHAVQFPDYKFRPRRKNQKDDIEKRPYKRRGSLKSDHCLDSPFESSSETLQNCSINPLPEASNNRSVNPPSELSVDPLKRQTIILKRVAHSTANVSASNISNVESSTFQPRKFLLVSRFPQQLTGNNFAPSIRVESDLRPALKNDHFLSLRNCPVMTRPMTSSAQNNTYVVSNLPRFTFHHKNTKDMGDLLRPVVINVPMNKSTIDQLTVDNKINFGLLNCSSEENSDVLNESRVLLDLKNETVGIDSKSRIVSLDENSGSVGESRTGWNNAKNLRISNVSGTISSDDSNSVGMDLRMKSPAKNCAMKIDQLIETSLGENTFDISADEPLASSFVHDAFVNDLRSNTSNSTGIEINLFDNELVIDDSNVITDAGNDANVDQSLFSTDEVEYGRSIQSEFNRTLTNDDIQMSDHSQCIASEHSLAIANAPAFMDLDEVIDDLIFYEFTVLRKNKVLFQLPFPLTVEEKALCEEESFPQLEELKTEFPEDLMDEIKQLL